MNRAVYVKICGLTSLRDAECAVEAGADFLGFVMVPESPRCISADWVRGLVRDLPGAVRKVGVVADLPLCELRNLLDSSGLDMLQLHGEEMAEAIRSLPRERLWKAVHLRTPLDVALAAVFPAAAIVADTAVGNRRGGTGRKGDWALARELARRTRTVLAGGLTPENVAEAVRRVRPFGVDVGSGVEAAPGRKDPTRVREFVHAAKAAGGVPVPCPLSERPQKERE
ncbi:MAG: phosphoribosylanthranilate isomerase [Kiritimatiellaeota bacterium]|nr:phosphoribosylanthranilate isomerase [Kiritimatiellota bacterium]